MVDSTAQIVSELNTLLRLTQTEAMVARTRRAQATTDAVRRELERNADKADRRSSQIRQMISDLGGVPDLLGIAIGRLTAGTKTVLEQGQTLTDALLSDLALEHHLRDRARVVRLLAEAGHLPRVVKLAERLEEAHAITVEWIEARLVEATSGGPGALRPTPVQSAVAAAQRAAFLPTRQLTAGVNSSIAAATRLQERLVSTVTENVQRTASRAETIGEATADVLATGRDAALERAEQLATEDGAPTTAETVHRTRAELGALHGDELAIPDYDSLTVVETAEAIEGLQDVQDVRAVAAYEAENKNRKGVLTAAESRIEELAASALA